MPAGKFSIRRILVALDASPQSLAALRAAVELGARLEAQLLGLFVEDIDLLRLAGSPFARELLFPTAKEIPLDRASMERKLKAQAEQDREALATAADEANIEWTFRVVRGSVASEILAAAAECDLLALGWRGWSLVKKPHMGSTASAAIGEAVPVLLLSARGILTELPILVWYDGTPTSKRGVLAAAELAQIGSRKLTVLLPLPERKTGNRLQTQVEDLLKGKEIQLRFEHIDPSDQASLRSVLRSERPSVIVLTGEEPFPKEDGLIDLLDEVDVSALLLREGSTFELE